MRLYYRNATEHRSYGNFKQRGGLRAFLWALNAQKEITLKKICVYLPHPCTEFSKRFPRIVEEKTESLLFYDNYRNSSVLIG